MEVLVESLHLEGSEHIRASTFGPSSIGSNQDLRNDSKSSRNEQTQLFYESLFNWSTRDLDFGAGGRYMMFNQSHHQLTGLVRMIHPEWIGLPPQWAMYVHVPDIDQSVQKVEKLGGTICLAPFEVPNSGKASLVLDPDGAAFYLFQPK